MASSSSRSASRVWPTVLGYVRREAMRIDVSERVIEESLSGLGIIDVNRKRIADRREPFTLATIMTGLHMSGSDPIPHITLAVATDKMRRDRQHRMVHVRTTSEEISEAQFIEAEVFSTREEDGKLLRESYKKPVLARTSLMPDKDEGKPFPVGYVMGPDNTENWYVLNKHGETLYIESGFYTAGEGAREANPDLTKSRASKLRSRHVKLELDVRATI
ncbi:hypothetical protein MAJ_06752, partial [Metarhizium majus ARSEF 297]